jgi:PIN domain nuclease of toxin-antitoxin system
VAITVLDASVVIAFLDGEDAHHRAAVEVIDRVRGQELVLPASAYAEVLVDPWRAGIESVGIVRRFLDEIGIRIEPLTTDFAARAARLRAVHRSLRLPDALVLATAEAMDAVALTADRSWARISRRARVV